MHAHMCEAFAEAPVVSRKCLFDAAFKLKLHVVSSSVLLYGMNRLVTMSTNGGNMVILICCYDITFR